MKRFSVFMVLIFITMFLQKVPMVYAATSSQVYTDLMFTASTEYKKKVIISNSGDFNADGINKGNSNDGIAIPYIVSSNGNYMEIRNWKLATGEWISDTNWNSSSNIRKVYIKFLDDSGNSSSIFEKDIDISGSEVLDYANINGGATYTNNPVVNISFKGASRCSGLQISGDAGASWITPATDPNDPSTNYRSNDWNLPFILTSGDEPKYITMKVNESTTASGIMYLTNTLCIILDQTPPVINNLNFIPQSSMSSTNSVVISGDFYDETSGIAKKFYDVGIHDISYFMGGHGNEFESHFTATLGNTYTICVEDNAGNYAVKTINVTAPAKPIITEISDLKKDYDARDLNVTFTSSGDESKVSEYRLFVVPSLEAAGFNLISASNIAPENYTELSKTGAASYTKTFTAGAKDVDGNEIVTGKAYKIFIMSVKDGMKANISTLSDASNEITLQSISDVTSVCTIPDIKVQNGTALGSIRLPSTVSEVLRNSTTVSTGVVWDNGTPLYNGNISGTYVFKGNLVLPQGVTNPDGKTASVRVIVAAEDFMDGRDSEDRSSGGSTSSGTSTSIGGSPSSGTSTGQEVSGTSKGKEAGGKGQTSWGNGNASGNNDTVNSTDSQNLQLPEIKFVGLGHSPLVEGDKEDFIISSGYDGNVQYKICLNVDGSWQEVTNGYSTAVSGKDTFTITPDYTFQKGQYQGRVYVKKAGTTGSKQENGIDFDNYYTYNINCVDRDDANRVYTAGNLNINNVQAANISSISSVTKAAIETDSFKAGQKVTITGIDGISGIPGPYYYRLSIYDVANDTWTNNVVPYSEMIEWTPSAAGTYVLDVHVITPNSVLWDKVQEDPTLIYGGYEGWKLKAIKINN